MSWLEQVLAVSIAYHIDDLKESQRVISVTLGEKVDCQPHEPSRRAGCETTSVNPMSPKYTPKTPLSQAESGAWHFRDPASVPVRGTGIWASSRAPHGPQIR